MRATEARYAWGALLILLGVVFLLQTMGLIPGDSALLWVILFAIGGLVFLYFFGADRVRNWWAVIPGLTLLGIALTIAVATYAPGPLENLAGGVFLGMIGLAFVAVYLVRPTFWWAIIPAGTLLTLALIAALSDVTQGGELGGVLFLGLAVTFAVLSLVPTPQGRMRWALIPAAVLFIMGVLITISALPIAGYLWPLLLIAAGLYLLFRSRGSGQPSA